MTIATPGRLGPAEHEAAWNTLRDSVFDVLVIGGGVTGCGAALDAATRGLRVALVEARDLASGTSSRSSKLFHGGLRYLESLELGLVREALRERDLMVTRLAPHLVRPVPFLYPLRHRGWERLYVGAGLLLYDGLAGAGRRLPRHRHLSARALRELAPGVSRRFVGGIRYYDAQTDDARHTVTLARTAALHGAVVRRGTEVVGLLREDGRVAGARVLDTETGAEIDVRARVVIGCTGVWSDQLDALAGGTVPGVTAVAPQRVRASKGVHLLVPRDTIDSRLGLITRTDRSVLFVIPWGEHWIVGTTDTPWDHDPAHPTATAADVAYLLEQANRVLVRPLRHRDVVGVYAGLRPLVSAGDVDTARVSREHVVDLSVPGLVSIAGGKYTTYRVMARDVVDAAVEAAGLSAASCRTDRTPLLGGVGYAAVQRDRPGIAARYGVSLETVDRLLGRYGDLVDEVLAPAAEDPELLRPVDGAGGYLGAELRYAVTHEGARSLDDVLSRRTRIRIETSHRGKASARQAAALAGAALGWDVETRADQVERYRRSVAAELVAQDCPDDASAGQARALVDGTVGRPAPVTVG